MRRRDDFDPGGGDDRDRPEALPRGGVQTKWIVAAVGAIVLLVFALQNSERVDVDFLVFDAQVRVVVVILVSAAHGVIVGWLVGRPSRGERKVMRRGLDD